MSAIALAKEEARDRGGWILQRGRLSTNLKTCAG